MPKVYGHISGAEKKLFIDLFDTTLAPEFQTSGSKHFIDKINFYPIESNYISLQIDLKANVTADVFYLENPARLVIDLKN